MPLKQLLVFGIAPRTIISMKRITAESRPDHPGSGPPPGDPSVPPASHLAPVSPIHPFTRRRSWCSLTGSTSSPKLVPSGHFVMHKASPQSKSDDLNTSYGFGQEEHSTMRHAGVLSVNSRLEHVAAEVEHTRETSDALRLKMTRSSNDSESEYHVQGVSSQIMGQAM